MKIRYTRPIPDRTTIKEVTFKKERTGEWFVSFGLETDNADLPEKPDVDSLDASNSVGIDLGIQNYIHTSDGKIVDWLDLEDEYERLQREQRKLSRKEKGSNNYEKQRHKVAKVKRHIRRTVLDYQHKITTWLVREYDAVFVEELNVKGMLEQSHNARNKQDAAWRQFIHAPRIQSRVVRHARRSGGSKRNDEGVCVVWRGNVETHLGAGTLLSELWVRDGQGRECGNERSQERLF